MLIIVVYQVLDSVCIDYRSTVGPEGEVLAPPNARLVHRREVVTNDVLNTDQLASEVGDGLRELDAYAGDLVDHYSAQ